MWVWIHHDLALFHPVTATKPSGARIYSDLWDPQARADRALSEPATDDDFVPDDDHGPCGIDVVDALDDLRHPHLHLQ